MATIPNHDAWMKSTQVLGLTRSDALKKLDAAIASRNEDSILEAFNGWRDDQSKKSKDWRKSARNKTGAMTDLHRALLPPPVLRPEELQALEDSRKLRQAALATQFQRAKVVFKKNTLLGIKSGNSTKFGKLQAAANGVGTAKSVVEASAALSGAASGGKDPIAQIKETLIQAVRDLCPGLEADNVMAAIGLPSVTDFATQAAPILGSLKSGVEMVKAWGAVAKTGVEKYEVTQARSLIAIGDPEAALDAVEVILNRELISNTASATSAIFTFSLQTAGLFADMGGVTGPAVALAQIVAKLLQEIYEYVRDYKEVERANELLDGDLNLELFKSCPLLGCYFIAVQDHSTLLAFALDGFGTENFVFDVERMLVTLKRVIESSRRMIQASKFEVVGVRIDDKTAQVMLISLQDQKGLVEQNYSVKTGLDKVMSFPEHVREVLTERFLTAVGKG